VEISADVDVFKNRDWKINVGANITFLKNKILTLPEQNKDGIVDGTKKIVEGKSRYEFFLYTYQGVNTQNGYSLYTFDDEKFWFEMDGIVYGNKTAADGTANTQITGDNLAGVTVIDGKPYTYLASTYGKREFHGSSLPTAYGSFNLNVSWKGLSLATLFTYQLGGQVYDGIYADLMSPGTSPYAYHTDVMKSWLPEQATQTATIDPNGIPMFNRSPIINKSVQATLNAGNSSRWLVSGRYLILKNINLTYQLPKTLVRKIDLEGIAVTLACENLFSLTARKGLNPQQSFSGMQYNYLVTPRVFSVGLNVKF
jgi:hypothetical protein